jgi:hypothetical protein
MAAALAQTHQLMTLLCICSHGMLAARARSQEASGASLQAKLHSLHLMQQASA